MKRSSRSISRPTVTCITRSIRSWRLARRVFELVRPLAALPRAVASIGLPCMAVSHPVGSGGSAVESGERSPQRRRKARRPAIGIEAGEAEREPNEKLLAAAYALVDLKRGAAKGGEA